MIKFVILLGLIGGWVIFASTLFLMLALGKMWVLLGVVWLIAGIEINHWLKARYMKAVVDYSPRTKELAAHIFEMNELIIMSSYVIAIALYVVIQKYVEIMIKLPVG